MASVNQLQRLLKFTYGLVPIVAGLDKFTNLLTDWPTYLGQNYRNMLPMDVTIFMKIVGVIEIIAGMLVFIRPLFGAYLVMVWLICIALVLVTGGGYYDVAVRDLVMATGAYTLAQLTVLSKTQNK
jgi:hypothetical protein